MDKKLIIGHQSALLVYRAAGSGIITAPEKYHAPVEVADCTTRITDFRESGNVSSLMDSGSLCLVARSYAQKHRAKNYKVCALPGKLPDDSFRSMGNNLLVTSPSLTLLQFCQDIESGTWQAPELEWCSELIDEFGDLGKLTVAAEVASELCGLYSIAPDKKGSLHRHAAFISRTKMARYLQACTRRKSVQLARAAIKAASPLSASPRETQLYLMMTMPWPMGYGLPQPLTNAQIVIEKQDLGNDEDCKTLRFADYCWPQKTLRSGRVRRTTTLEYDSDEFHTEAAGLTDKQLADQSERRDQIEVQGNNFLRITTAQTRDFSRFDAKMRQLAKLLRIDLPEHSTEELDVAKQFFELIFDTNRYKKMPKFR